LPTFYVELLHSQATTLAYLI